MGPFPHQIPLQEAGAEGADADDAWMYCQQDRANLDVELGRIDDPLDVDDPDLMSDL